MRVYCSLWDKNYMLKGLALHASLMLHARPFHLYILALDDETFWLLDELGLDSVTIIPLHVVESRLNLLPVRTSRNWMEYCWTLASQFMQFLLQRDITNSMNRLTYLDADLFFFSSPEPVFDAMADASIAIVPHRFHAGNIRLAVNGVYNVGWLTIKNDQVGTACLNKWAAQCRDWCYHRNEDGKFGDQGYLDSWPAEYGAACTVIAHIGAGLAPWNVMVYGIHQADPPCLTDYGPDRTAYHCPLIFYHFHEFTHDAVGNTTRLTRHPHIADHKRLIYAPYSAAIQHAATRAAEARQNRQSSQDRAKTQGERT